MCSPTATSQDLEVDDPPARHQTHARRRARALPACGQQGVHCRIDCQPGQPVRAGIEGGELPERGRAGRGAGDGGSKEKVLDALGEAASKLRGELGESLASVQKLDAPLSEATTSSLEALQVYSLGRKAEREKGPAAGLPYRPTRHRTRPEFRHGVRRQSLRTTGALGEPGRARDYITKAFELREHASEREKLEIEIDYYGNVTGELEKALQASASTDRKLSKSWWRHGFGHLVQRGGSSMRRRQRRRIVMRFSLHAETTLIRIGISPTSCSPYKNSLKPSG
jgi:hypothetical protein